MNKIALTAAACLIALSAAGCAVEVPMSAFRLTPPDAGQKVGPKSSQSAPQDTRALSVR